METNIKLFDPDYVPKLEFSPAMPFPQVYHWCQRFGYEAHYTTKKARKAYKIWVSNHEELVSKT